MEQNSAISEKERRQQQLLHTHAFTYLGNGPLATGAAQGWRMSPGLYFKCVVCEYLMQANPLQDDECFCGALVQDASWGRFGSRLGDQAIEGYRGVSKAANDKE